MRTCPHCQSANPSGHRFCQSCGKPLSSSIAAVETRSAEDSRKRRPIPTYIPLEATLLAPAYDPLNAEALNAEALNAEALNRALDQIPKQGSDQTSEKGPRYRIVTTLSERTALVEDTQPERRSPLQSQLFNLTNPSLAELQAIAQLPSSVYPYYLLSGAAPSVYDAWAHGAAAVVITRSASPPLASILTSFASTDDALKHVYWLYGITELWVGLETVPGWRTSILLADHLGIDSEQSVRIRRFIRPSKPPEFSHLKAFLRSLLAQPNRVSSAPSSQAEKIDSTLASAPSLQQLRSELSIIGEALLSAPTKIAPSPPPHTDISQNTLPGSNPAPTMADNTSADNTPADDLSSLGSTHLNGPAPGNAPSASAFDQTAFDPADSLEDLALLEESDHDEANDDATMVLPMKLLDISAAGRTDVGRQRDHNEDCFFIRSSTQKHSDNTGQTAQTHSLYVLCDGMGGHAGGEVASRLAAETLSAYFEQHWPHPLPNQAMKPLPTEAVITTAVQLANQAIFDINEKERRAGHERMGTTLVMVLVQGAEAVVAHVGDSRLYRYARREGLKQVTTDHEVGQREIQRGIPHEIAYARPDAYQLTQALGPRDNEEIAPSVSYLHFSEDTLLLLCSDGLSDNNLVEDHLGSHIDPILRGRKDIDAGVDELMLLANEVNGHDNISAIAIRLKVSPDLTSMRKPAANRGLTVIQ